MTLKSRLTVEHRERKSRGGERFCRTRSLFLREKGVVCNVDHRGIGECRHIRTSTSCPRRRLGICLASTSIWHDQRINPARIFSSVRSSSGWRLPGMRFYRFVDPCPDVPCICMSTSTHDRVQSIDRGAYRWDRASFFFECSPPVRGEHRETSANNKTGVGDSYLFTCQFAVCHPSFILYSPLNLFKVWV